MMGHDMAECAESTFHRPKRGARTVRPRKPWRTDWSLQQVTEHGIPELGFEPGAFGRHDTAGVGDTHEILNAGWEHTEGAGEFAAVDPFDQLVGAPNPTDE